MTTLHPCTGREVDPFCPRIGNSARVEAKGVDEPLHKTCDLVGHIGGGMGASVSESFGSHAFSIAVQSISTSAILRAGSTSTLGFSLTSCTVMRGARSLSAFDIHPTSSWEHGTVIAHASLAVGFQLSLSTASPASIASAPCTV